MRLNPGIVLILPVLTGAAAAQSLSEKEFEKKVELFGEDFIIERIEAPVIENPHDWVNRQPGDYVYRFVTGSDDGETTQVETHIPDSENPDTAWQRRIGDDLVESFTSSDERDLFIVEEVDHQHGFRVMIEPGIHIPPGITPGDMWEVDAELAVYNTEDGSFVNDGTLEALHSYEGAYRVRTPAGDFDTVVIREDFKLHIGPLKAEDDRLLFFARGVGLVAEEEALRASAILVIRMKEESAKVLVEYPEGIKIGASAARATTKD
ncbi:MAG: hypothetical protein V2I25_08300 [Woeseiaceae bacterium]|jgi:hypothetical protein|nr:hypothetical protein [Woeseiaceae bacterium]